MAAPVVIILTQERRIAEAFERAGATAPDRARGLHELGVDPDGLAWRRLHDRSVLREAGANTRRFYLDRDAWYALRQVRRRIGVALLLAIVVAIFVFKVFRS
ncbi:MAG TPA: hypothetical protein VJU15_12255 [Gemmatimonadales bacterium]|nr:hypothetical protein [Gemmatimonadales bacterium]